MNRDGGLANFPKTRLVMVGELTLDEIIVEDVGSFWKEPGGGALYSALGALVWGAQPVLCSAVGSNYPDDIIRDLTNAGIDTVGITPIEGNGLGIWLLYESGGYRHQVPKASGATFERMDRTRRPWDELALETVDGVHVAPQTVSGQIDANQRVSRAGVISTMDVMVEPFIEIERYRTGEAIQGATALLLNETESRQIWGEMNPKELRDELSELGGIKHLVVKQGERGAKIVTSDDVVQIPALSHNAIDPTGAGDAFSGGFLAGLVRTGDPVEAGIWGAVSASITVEVRGATEILKRIKYSEIRNRQTLARSLVRTGE